MDVSKQGHRNCDKVEVFVQLPRAAASWAALRFASSGKVTKIVHVLHRIEFD